MSGQSSASNIPSFDAIVRAVASSTAIETGEPIASIEARLRRLRSSAAPRLSLAFRPPAKPAQG